MREYSSLAQFENSLASLESLDSQKLWYPLYKWTGDRFAQPDLKWTKYRVDVPFYRI
jgi:hypothetical protein